MLEQFAEDAELAFEGVPVGPFRGKPAIAQAYVDQPPDDEIVILRTNESGDDLVSGQDVFVAATGVTTGALLRGVRYLPGGAVTDSIVMRSRSGTVRRIEATHSFDKLEKFSGREYR